MASANLDFVRSIHAAWERGDYSSVDWADPEIEFVFADGPEPGAWRGAARASAAWRDFLDSWEGWRTKADEYRELDDERVLVLFHYSARGKTSGMELGETGAKGAHVLHVRGGKVTKLVIYFDRDRAFTDLGLASEAGSPRS